MTPEQHARIFPGSGQMPEQLSERFKAGDRIRALNDITVSGMTFPRGTQGFVIRCDKSISEVFAQVRFPGIAEGVWVPQSDIEHTSQVLVGNAEDWEGEGPEVGPDHRQVGGLHYQTMEMQPWEAMEALLTREEWVGFLKGNLLKYAMRQGRKVDADDDAEKARHYAEKLRSVLKQ